jgi:hypothetical protein
MFEKASGAERQRRRQGAQGNRNKRVQLLEPTPPEGGREIDSNLTDAGTSPGEEKRGSQEIEEHKMKSTIINKAKMIELENSHNFAQIIDSDCQNETCKIGTVVEFVYETKTTRHVYHVCTQCGNVEKINI